MTAEQGSPTTEAGRRMLRRLAAGTGTPRPFARYEDRGTWDGDVAAIEAEAYEQGLKAGLTEAIALVEREREAHRKQVGSGWETFEPMCTTCGTYAHLIKGIENLRDKQR